MPAGHPQVEAVLLETVGDTAAVKAVLQPTHAVMVERARLLGSVIGASPLTSGMSRFIVAHRLGRDQRGAK